MSLSSRLALIAAVAGAAGTASAQYYASADFVPGSGGSTLYYQQFIGSHFTVPNGFLLDVTAIGGNVWTATPNGKMWGAIVDVNINTGLPFSTVDDANYLHGTTLYTGGDPTSIDVVSSLVVTLPAGDYGVVLGGDDFGGGHGLFGSNGWGAIPGSNNIPNGTNDFFDSGGVGNWNNVGEQGWRLTVYGELRAVPAPGAVSLLGLGGLVAARRRRA
jgi:hypothetical protein